MPSSEQLILSNTAKLQEIVSDSEFLFYYKYGHYGINKYLCSNLRDLRMIEIFKSSQFIYSYGKTYFSELVMKFNEMIILAAMITFSA